MISAREILEQTQTWQGKVLQSRVTVRTSNLNLHGTVTMINDTRLIIGGRSIPVDALVSIKDRHGNMLYPEEVEA